MQVQVVLGYNGSVFGTSIVYILPALMSVNLLYKKRYPSFTQMSSSSVFSFLCSDFVNVLPQILILLFGVFMLIGGCIATALFDSSSSSQNAQYLFLRLHVNFKTHPWSTRVQEYQRRMARGQLTRRVLRPFSMVETIEVKKKLVISFYHMIESQQSSHIFSV